MALSSRLKENISSIALYLLFVFGPIAFIYLLDVGLYNGYKDRIIDDMIYTGEYLDHFKKYYDMQDNKDSVLLEIINIIENE